MPAPPRLLQDRGMAADRRVADTRTRAEQGCRAWSETLAPSAWPTCCPLGLSSLPPPPSAPTPMRRSGLSRCLAHLGIVDLNRSGVQRSQGAVEFSARHIVRRVAMLALSLGCDALRHGRPARGLLRHERLDRGAMLDQQITTRQHQESDHDRANLKNGLHQSPRRTDAAAQRIICASPCGAHPTPRGSALELPQTTPAQQENYPRH